ncbi:hypothetical protein F2Q69_00026580 [Brassica cretica]|uniref:Uncharacterized protein n=1 Tax=Brassica cretica TaxID=69181 RepID=A0A8S9S0K9_BRACR|nr:hypothetical protein F2Q69_00026580 [Brassica cretica]
MDRGWRPRIEAVRGFRPVRSSKEGMSRGWSSRDEAVRGFKAVRSSLSRDGRGYVSQTRPGREIGAYPTADYGRGPSQSVVKTQKSLYPFSILV